MISLRNLVFIAVIATTVAKSVVSPAVSTIQANGEFAKHFYKEVSQKDGNVLISPASAHACLSMLYQAASGTIKQDFETVLGVTSTSAADGYQTIIQGLNNAKIANVTIANKIYIADYLGLKQSFAEIVDSKFFSEVESIDFSDTPAAALKINNWVKEKTKNKIPKIFEKKDLENAFAALINTIYFKDAWSNKFDELNTHQRPFYFKDGSIEDVTTMGQTEHFAYREDNSLDAKILVLPYEDPDFSMVIVLPNKKDGITELETKLQDVDITRIASGVVPTRVRVSLPKFKFSIKIDLEDILKQMGLEKIFVPSYELAGMVDMEEPISVSKAIQKVFIQVDENGSEAAAATALVEIFESSPVLPEEPPVEFKADHPFVFLLTHKLHSTDDQQNIIFFGKIEKPVFEKS